MIQGVSSTSATHDQHLCNTCATLLRWRVDSRGWLWFYNLLCKLILSLKYSLQLSVPDICRPLNQNCQQIICKTPSLSYEWKWKYLPSLLSFSRWSIRFHTSFSLSTSCSQPLLSLLNFEMLNFAIGKSHKVIPGENKGVFCIFFQEACAQNALQGL